MYGISVKLVKVKSLLWEQYRSPSPIDALIDFAVKRRMPVAVKYFQRPWLFTAKLML